LKKCYNLFPLLRLREFGFQTADPIIKRALVTPQEGEDSFFKYI